MDIIAKLDPEIQRRLNLPRSHRVPIYIFQVPFQYKRVQRSWFSRLVQWIKR